MEDESLPVGFTLVRVPRSPTSVHVAEPVHICTTFAAAPLVLVPREPKPAGIANRIARIIADEPVSPVTPIRSKCVNPPTHEESVAAWRLRRVEYENRLAAERKTSDGVQEWELLEETKRRVSAERRR